ncbi:MAG: DUF3429 domain-containing protein [Gammaproteobacteria bacterium]
MQKTKVTLIYWGLCLFVFLALIPWIFNPTVAMHSIQVLAIYGGIVVAFLGGMIWGWDDSQASSANFWCAIGFSLLGFGVALASFVNLPASLILLIFSLQIFLSFEKKNSLYFQTNIKYANARILITNLVTICCITSLAFLHNPYT